MTVSAALQESRIIQHTVDLGGGGHKPNSRMALDRGSPWLFASTSPHFVHAHEVPSLLWPMAIMQEGCLSAFGPLYHRIPLDASPHSAGPSCSRSWCAQGGGVMECASPSPVAHRLSASSFLSWRFEEASNACTGSPFPSLDVISHWHQDGGTSFSVQKNEPNPMSYGPWQSLYGTHATQPHRICTPNGRAADHKHRVCIHSGLYGQG